MEKIDPREYVMLETRGVMYGVRISVERLGRSFCCWLNEARKIVSGLFTGEKSCDGKDGDPPCLSPFTAENCTIA